MRITYFSLIFLLLSVCSQAPANPGPKLVILLSVDQMRADYLNRFRNDFTGGFKRFVEEGMVFENASLNYAPSETGPGHATLATGCYPWKSGIVSNNWIDPSSHADVYCVQDSLAAKTDGEGGGASPRNLEVPALGDWLRQASPESKVVAISAKDRAAILMGGLHPTGTYWYDTRSGHMVTSSYYTNSDPQWVRDFNAADWVDHNLPPAWTKLREDAWYSRVGPDSMRGEKPWDGSITFPHAFATDKRKSQVVSSPFGDQMLLDFALDAVTSEKLGMLGPVDLLCISLSCTDYIGHAFGPNSQEMADQMLRLDKALGTFLTSVEAMVGSGNLLVGMSADHAVMPLPEYQTAVLHQSARRIPLRTEVNPAVDSLDRELQREFNTTANILRIDGILNYGAAAAAGVDSLELEHRVREGSRRIPGVADIYFRREILNNATPDRPYLEAYRHGYDPKRGDDFLVRICENCLVTSSKTGTSHGTPYEYDTHVPVVFWGAGVKAGTVERPVHSVDVAPTLLKMLGYSPPPFVDGVALNEVFH